MPNKNCPSINSIGVGLANGRRGWSQQLLSVTLNEDIGGKLNSGSCLLSLDWLCRNAASSDSCHPEDRDFSANYEDEIPRLRRGMTITKLTLTVGVLGGGASTSDHISNLRNRLVQP